MNGKNFPPKSLKPLTRISHALPPQPISLNTPHLVTSPFYSSIPLFVIINPDHSMPYSHFSSNPSSSSFSSISTMDKPKIEVLHFDVPLISTRRSTSVDKCNSFNSNYHGYSTDTSRSVPFLWERTPGVPKESSKEHPNSVYTPKPPPGKWCPSSSKRKSSKKSSSSVNSSDTYNDDAYKNFAMDTGPSVMRAPSFIMNRFLPAANAIAESSVAGNFPKYPTPTRSREVTRLRIRKVQEGYCGHLSGECNNVQHVDLQPKACGIMLLFPWSNANKAVLCGLKSPIRKQSSTKSSRVDAYDACRSNVVDGENDDGVSSKAWKSAGWGLPFLDSSRFWRRKGKKMEEGRARTLPKLDAPSEPWLENALNSVNRRRY